MAAGTAGLPALGVELLVGMGKLVSAGLSSFFFFFRAFPSNSRNLQASGTVQEFSTLRVYPKNVYLQGGSKLFN